MSNKVVVKRLGRPPGADAERTRNAVLDAALRAFAERGYEGTSIREITNDVGVGHNVVRHYFGSKEDLWRAAVRRAFGDLSNRLVALLDSMAEVPAPETLRAGLGAMMIGLAENPAAIRLLADEALRGGARLNYLYEEFIGPAGVALLRYVSRSKPEFAAVDPRVLGLFVLSAGIAPFTLGTLAARVGIAVPRPGGPLDDHVRQLIDLIVAGATSRDH